MNAKHKALSDMKRMERSHRMGEGAITRKLKVKHEGKDMKFATGGNREIKRLYAR